jgi:hypothetical protein
LQILTQHKRNERAQPPSAAMTNLMGRRRGRLRSWIFPISSERFRYQQLPLDVKNTNETALPL